VVRVPVKRIVLLSRMDEAVAAGAPEEGPAVDVARTPLLAQAPALERLGRYLGRPIGPETIKGLRLEVMAAYARAGRPFVQVAVPSQDVSNGVLQLVVTEGRLGRLSVEGARRFGEAVYRKALRQSSGEPIDARRLQADLDWINRNPYRHAAIVVQPGDRFGVTDLVLNVQERRPFSVNAGVDDTGTDSTGLERLSAGFDWGNAFGRGDDLNYQFQASTDFRALRQHNLSYTAGLPWRHSLSLSLAYAATRSEDPLGDVGATGVTRIAAVRYAAPLPRRGPFTHHLAAGFDFKSTNNDILFGGRSVFPTTSEVDQFLVEYGGQASDRLGGESFTLTLVGSPGGLTAHNDDADFRSQQLGATARYVYVRLSASRTTALPARLVWTAHLTGQLAGANLLASEQLVFGGYASVRGFAEQAATRDDGIVVQNEIGPGPLRLDGLAAALGLPKGSVVVSPFLFLDSGAGRNHHDPEGTGSSSVGLVSAGPGLDLQVSSHLSGRLTWGSQLHRSGAAGARVPVQFAVRGTF